MSLKLENLPLELFGALSELLFANELCWLWLSGSKRIHHLLEQGVSCFHHLPARRRAYLWPSFISRFKRLQIASFSSHMPSNSAELYRSVVLSDIPPSITSLKLKFPNGIFALFQPSSMETDILSMMPLATMFPNLHHLEVLDTIGTVGGWEKSFSTWDPIFVLHSSCLHLSTSKSIDAQLLRTLSPTISSLELSSVKGEADSFPPYLVHLSLEGFSGKLDTSVLPKTLRRLTLHCDRQALLECHNWPSKLEFLSIDHSRLHLGHEDVKALPNTLLSLAMAIGSLEFACLHDLPQKLTFLIFNYRALYTISDKQWTHFEPKRLPPSLVDFPMAFFSEHTLHERLNTFPTGIRPSLRDSIQSRSDIVPSTSLNADYVDMVAWSCPEPETNWPFKKLSILSFGECVHPGQVYLTLPLLPLLEELQLTRYIEDPSLALNRIASPFFVRLIANCHPLSLCKWDNKWFQHVNLLYLRYNPSCAPHSDWMTKLISSGSILDDSTINDILAMDIADLKEWKRFGETITKKNGKQFVSVNWSRYAALLPRSLTDFDYSGLEPMDNYLSTISTSKCAWPTRMTGINAFLPPHLWSTLPESLASFTSCVEGFDLVNLAKDIQQLPKRLNSIEIYFLHSTDVPGAFDLQIFVDLLQKRPHLTNLSIGGEVIRLSSGPKIPAFKAAIEATFAPRPSI